MRMKYALAASAAVLLYAAPVEAQSNLPALAGQPLVDAADVLTPDQEATINAELRAVNAAAGHQVAVAVVPDLDGYSPEQYANTLFRKWGLGDAKRQDGVLLLVAIKERKSKIEVGYHLEPFLTDGQSHRINQEEILPRFKQKDMQGGIMAGVDAIGAVINKPAVAAVPLASVAPAQPTGGSGGLWLLLGGVLGLGTLGTLALTAAAHKRREREAAEAEAERTLRRAKYDRERLRLQEDDRRRAERNNAQSSRRDSAVFEPTTPVLRKDPKPTRRSSDYSSTPSYSPPPPSYSPPPPSYSPPPPPPPSPSYDYGSSYSPPPPPPPSPSFDGGGGSSGGGGDTGSW